MQVESSIEQIRMVDEFLSMSEGGDVAA